MNGEMFLKWIILIFVVCLLIVEVFRIDITIWEIVIKCIVILFTIIIIVKERRKKAPSPTGR